MRGSGWAVGGRHSRSLAHSVWTGENGPTLFAKKKQASPTKATSARTTTARGHGPRKGAWPQGHPSSQSARHLVEVTQRFSNSQGLAGRTRAHRDKSEGMWCMAEKCEARRPSKAFAAFATPSPCTPPPTPTTPNTHVTPRLYSPPAPGFSFFGVWQATGAPPSRGFKDLVRRQRLTTPIALGEGPRTPQPRAAPRHGHGRCRGTSSRRHCRGRLAPRARAGAPRHHGRGYSPRIRREEAHAAASTQATTGRHHRQARAFLHEARDPRPLRLRQLPRKEEQMVRCTQGRGLGRDYAEAQAFLCPSPHPPPPPPQRRFLPLRVMLPGLQQVCLAPPQARSAPTQHGGRHRRPPPFGVCPSSTTTTTRRRRQGRRGRRSDD